MATTEIPKLEQQLQPINIQVMEVTHSPRGNKLQNRIVLHLPKPKTPSEKMIQEHVINSFSWKMPALIPFTFQNNTVLNLAKHLKRHATGSSATLYQYVYGVYRFSKWIKRDPDTIVKEAEKNHHMYVAIIDDFIGDLQAQGLAPGTIANHVKSVRPSSRRTECP